MICQHAINTSNDLKTFRKKLENAWSNFIEKDSLDSVIVRPLIANSWSRCKSIGVDPFSKRAPITSSLQIKNSYVSYISKITIDKLQNSLTNLNSMAALFNTEKTIIALIGDPSKQHLAEATNFLPGTQWSECNVGTTGHSVALETRQVCEVIASEHYCFGFHDYMCVAIPILNPMNSHPVGAIEIVGLSPGQRFERIQLVINSVRDIETDLFRNHYRNNYLLLKSAFTKSLNNTEFAIAITDDTGQICYSNEIFEKSLAFNQGLKKKIINKLQFLLDSSILNTCDEVTAEIFDKSEAIKLILSPICHKGKLLGYETKFRQLNNKTIIPKNQNYLKNDSNSFKKIVGTSSQIKRAIKIAAKAAKTQTTILLVGETGSGKELFAEAIHRHSERADFPFVCINCGAVPDNLLESELFGYEEGSFTGAKRGGQAGHFEMADGGTIFFDEISEMSHQMQIKLLRVLENHRIRRIGSSKEIRVNVRIIAASNRDLWDMTLHHHFRKDLFYRIAVFKIELPPLRDRIKDIPLIANTILSQFSNDKIKIDASALKLLKRHRFEGNVRELRNILESAAISCTNNIIKSNDLPIWLKEKEDSEMSDFQISNLRHLEIETIKKALKKNNGNKKRTAKELGIPRSTLYNKIKDHKIY
jgi:transcriptional regulator with PAS, ATPase and Fis domain